MLWLIVCNAVLLGLQTSSHLFAEAFPAWFGHVGCSLYTLFQVMTLESWSMGISRPVMEKFPFAWAFFVPFILVSTYTMLNLFIAVIVGATQEQAMTEKAEQAEQAGRADPDLQADPPGPVVHDRVLLDEIRALREEVADLRRSLARGG